MENLKQWVESKRLDIIKRANLTREALAKHCEKNSASVGSSGYRIVETRFQNQIKKLEKISYEIMQRYNNLEPAKVDLFNDLQYESSLELFSGEKIFDHFFNVSVKIVLDSKIHSVIDSTCLVLGCDRFCFAICSTEVDSLMMDFAVCDIHFSTALKSNHSAIHSDLKFGTELCALCKKSIAGKIRRSKNGVACHDSCAASFRDSVRDVLFGRDDD